MSACGPSVWTGRALQVESDDLEIIGLAHLYPALAWSVCAAVKAHEIAEVTDVDKLVKLMTDEELLRIAAGGTPPRLLTVDR